MESYLHDTPVRFTSQPCLDLRPRSFAIMGRIPFIQI